MYSILIDYTTGNSFVHERIPEEELGIITSDLDKAKENLKRIKEHYTEYNLFPNFGSREPLSLLTDDGPRTITPFWIGYFETLHGAKIVDLADNDMSFNLED